MARLTDEELEKKLTEINESLDRLLLEKRKTQQEELKPKEEDSFPVGLAFLLVLLVFALIVGFEQIWVHLFDGKLFYKYIFGV
jgi:hypothetical protein